PCCEPLDEPCPACAPGAAEMKKFICRLTQCHGPVMWTKGLALDDHAVIEQDMQDVEQRQLRAAPCSSPGREGTAHFALERPRVALDGDFIKKTFHFPLHRAKTGG